ncbi:DUF2087 domain-containing protein [Aerococcus agrisoli]|uniref:DUF2087 domain-containing protein n=1 Tax=Aerococcus agrisoli TaxID=2487350 RepID=A0A3N4GJS5_9LACT|nr:DUF2087 domain-containing protein [Aerococcus agrisoli]RPA62425.1 DUF2087 domain-containing protein [Aerococcus agrisoli]
MDIINNYIDQQGKINIIPRKQKGKIVVFEYMMAYISQNGTHFTEKELNDTIQEIYTDFATMRRYLIDYQYLERDPYGKCYAVIERKES